MSNNENTYVVFPAGRLLGGHASKPQTKDDKGNDLVLTRKSARGEIGDKTQKWVVQVGYEKGSQAWHAAFSQVFQKAVEDHPTMFPQGFIPTATCPAETLCTNPQYKWKITDGDSVVPDRNGRKECDKVGRPGHWVVSFTNVFQCPDVGSVMSGEFVEDNNDDLMPRGNYVQVVAKVEGNSEQGANQGVFMTQVTVALAGYGEPIKSGPDSRALMAGKIGAAAGAPAGMSTTPVAGSALNNSVPQAKAYTREDAAAKAAANPPTNPFSKPQGDTAAPPAPPAPTPPKPPAPPSTPAMAPGCPYTFKQLEESGYTEQQMRDAGYLA